jgi:hypothetical protein
MYDVTKPVIMLSETLQKNNQTNIDAEEYYSKLTIYIEIVKLKLALHSDLYFIIKSKYL